MPSCARLLSYWTRYSERPWQDPFDATRWSTAWQYIVVQPLLVIQFLSEMDTIHLTLAYWKPWQSRMSQSVPKGLLLPSIVSVDCCRHGQYILGKAQYAAQSADCGAIPSFIEITCLFGQTCSIVITVHCIDHCCLLILLIQDDVLSDENRTICNSP